MEDNELVALLAKYGEIDNVDANGHSALHRAIISNQLGQVSLLVASGADVRKVTPQMLTPLELSFEQIKSRQGSLRIAEVLLEKKADPNVVDPQGQTLFLKALEAGMLDYMRLLVRFGVDIDQANPKGDVPIHRAFLFHGKELESVLNVLVQGRINLEAKDATGNTALLKAVDTNQASAVEILLKAGANQEAVDANGNTPLHLAAGKGLERIAKLLLDAGANPESRNHAHKKPLHLAKEANKFEVVELLRTKTLERRIAPYLQAQLQPLLNEIAELKRQNVELQQAVAKVAPASSIAANNATPATSLSMAAPSVATTPRAFSPTSFWSQSTSVASSSSMSSTTSLACASSKS